METNSPPSNSHFLQWVIEILIPYLALLLGVAILRTTRRQQKFGPGCQSEPVDQAELRYEDKLETAYDIGYEAWILGFGITVVLFGSSEFEAILKTQLAIVMPFVVAIPMIAILYWFGTSAYSHFVKAVVSIVAGTLAFAVITAMVTWVREQQSLRLTIVLGLLSWVIPCAAFVAFVIKLKHDRTKEKASARKRTAVEAGKTETRPA
jgi:hypothetical protein